MKKYLVCLLLSAILLGGCSAQRLVETVNDEFLLSVSAPVHELSVQLPAEASLTVFSEDTGDAMYLCKDYSVAVQTMAGGDLNQTLRSLCGFGREELTVMETSPGGLKRYDWIWSCAGEGGAQVGRGAVLDDGDYHYCVCVMADESVAGALSDQWDTLFSSVTLRRGT